MEQNTLLGIVIFLAILIVAVTVFFYMQISALQKRYDAMMTDMQGKNLETMFLARIADLAKIQSDINALYEQQKVLHNTLQSCVQKVGVVRFNAFDDTGSDLSFAISLLDAKNDGVVFSSIYGRNEARCYAKPINNSVSTYMLSDEEKTAIDISKNKK